MSKRLGVLTSGGDCAGLNAAIRAAVLRAVKGHRWDVVGILQGTLGMMQTPPEHVTLKPEAMSGPVLRSAGTILGTTNWGDPFAFPTPEGGTQDRSADVAEGYRALGLDALIAIGGDGSLNILRRIARQHGMNLIGIPKTIDNDLGQTESTIGYNTAVSVATEALDRLHPTAASHHRIMILEVMGRDAGHIALAAGISGGADVILIPEIPYTLANVAEKIAGLRAAGRDFALITVAEGVRTLHGDTVVTEQADGRRTYGGIGHYLADCLGQLTESETRVTVLGHVQRGAAPIARDRLMASAFGVHAADLAVAGRFDRMVAWQGRKVIDVPLGDATASSKRVDPDGALVSIARGLDISLGD